MGGVIAEAGCLPGLLGHIRGSKVLKNISTKSGGKI